jgi:glycosyltransferase involved in cell wall biosynthesis
MPKYSVVIPSLLADYRTAAKDRDKKIIRAVNSVLLQTYQDFEVIIIADGCQKTVEVMKQVMDPRISTILITRNKLWSGEPRNAGIQNATGEFIIYLDIDDLYGENHLQIVADQLNSYDWVWFDDIRYSPRQKQWYVNPCEITQISRHGTSNICHKRLLPVKWDHSGYAHDFYFVRQLRDNKNYTKIYNTEYYVMHVPNANTGGYDL